LKDGKLSDVVEKSFYEKQDDYLGKILREVHSALDLRTVPVFSGEALSTIRSVVLHLIKRNPNFTKDLNDEAIGLEVTEKTLSIIDKFGDPYGEKDRLNARLKNSKELKHVGRTVRVPAQLTVSGAIDEALQDFRVRWVLLSGKSSFILPGIGAYRIGNGGPNGFNNPDFEIWLPISPKRALVLVRDPKEKIPNIFVATRDHVRKVNKYGASQSTQIASHSQQLLKSLIKKP
jgi:hypothetical protein